jgi:hypothetical protein
MHFNMGLSTVDRRSQGRELMVELELIDLEAVSQRELSPLKAVKVMLPRCIS